MVRRGHEVRQIHRRIPDGLWNLKAIATLVSPSTHDRGQSRLNRLVRSCWGCFTLVQIQSGSGCAILGIALEYWRAETVKEPQARCHSWLTGRRVVRAARARFGTVTSHFAPPSARGSSLLSRLFSLERHVMRWIACSCLCLILPAAAWTQGTVVFYPQQAPSSVVVVVREPTMAEPPPTVHYPPSQQIGYFIAFKSDVVSLADQYWVNGNTLYYVTLDHLQKTAPLDSVDRSVSEQLNMEQNVEFQLPVERPRLAAATTPEVKSRSVRHTATVARPCRCGSGSRTSVTH
jgi:hypothetical protein